MDLDAYVRLLEALSKRKSVGMSELASAKEPFVAIRHFVDREASRAARMAKLELRLGVRGTYYFAWDAKIPHYDRGYPSDRNPGGFPAHQVIEVRLYKHEVGYLHMPSKERFDVDERLAALRKLAPVQSGVDSDGNCVAGACLNAPDFDGMALFSDAKGSWRLSTGEKVGGTEKLIERLPECPRCVLDVHPRLWTHGKMEKALGLVGR
jgi:hypothetical protein